MPSAVCNSCGLQNETFLHCIRDCSHSKTVWHHLGFVSADFFLGGGGGPRVPNPSFSQLDFGGLGIIEIPYVSATTLGLCTTSLSTYIIQLRLLNLTFQLMSLLHQLIVWLNGKIITTFVLFLKWTVLEQGCFTSHLLSFGNNKVLKIINWIC